MSVAREIPLVPKVEGEEVEQKLTIIEPGMLEANVPAPTSIALSFSESNLSRNSILIDSPSAEVVGQILSRKMVSTTRNSPSHSTYLP